MKILFFICALMVSATAYAEDILSGAVGNYIGLSAGGTKLNAKSKLLPDMDGNFSLVKPSNNGFGMRAFYGYQFGRFVAVETGLGYYSPATYSIPNGNSPETRIQVAFDIEGKGILPVFVLTGLNLYAKGGAAILMYKQGGLLVPSNSAAGSTNAQSGASGITARPLVGLGISYSFTPNWVVELSGTRLLGGGAVPQADYYSVGLSYHAVDLYCGQFLCPP